MIRGDATEAQHIEAVMRIHRCDEAHSRFILAVERRRIAGDVMPDVFGPMRRVARLGRTVDGRGGRSDERGGG